MSHAAVLEFGTENRFKDLAFPDLEARFNGHLEGVRSIPDLDHLVSAIKPLFQDERFSADEIERLKKMRQRAYDRKRNPKFLRHRSEEHRSVIPLAKSEASDASRSARAISKPSAIFKSSTTKEQKAQSFGRGVVKALSTLDGERFVKAIQKALLWFSAAAMVSYFLWQQSLTLYETAGFVSSTNAATGGILMIIGFAAYHAIARSWLALLLCLYAGAYEGYLMISGTINNDDQMHMQATQSNPELVFLAEKADREHGHYQELKQRYDNPESKVYKNKWFAKNHLNPAWESSAGAQGELIAKRALLLSASGDTHVTWLKIFYRLGLVFLCMILVHRFFSILCAKQS